MGKVIRQNLDGIDFLSSIYEDITYCIRCKNCDRLKGDRSKEQLAKRAALAGWVVTDEVVSTGTGSFLSVGIYCDNCVDGISKEE